MGPTADGPPEWITLYYDPLLRLNNTANVALNWLWWAFFLLPIDRERARSFYEVIKARFVVDKADGSAFIQPAPGANVEDVYLTARALSLAHELGDGEIAGKLRTHAEASYEPTWDRQAGDFYYLFGLREPYPRGQFNAQLMLSEIGGPGAWWRLFNEPNLRKFEEPTVCGVDYPRVGLSEAYYDPGRRALALQTYAATPAAAGGQTRFRLVGLRRPEKCSVLREGAPYDRVRVHNGSLEIEATIEQKRYQVIEG
jgi:hypothetical protein